MKYHHLPMLRASWLSAASVALVLLGGSPRTGCAGDPVALAPLPFKLEVVEVPNSTMPAIHSYSSATAGGKWLILGGRIAGLHGFGDPKQSFPRSTANTMAYVVDPGSNAVLGSVDLVQTLPAL